MKGICLYVVLLLLTVSSACHDDESYKEDQPVPLEPADIQLLLTGRVGSVVDASLTDYVDALNLFLFRENGAGNYVLFRQKVFTKDELRGLENGEGDAESGFTLFKEISFDTVPVGNYRIIGVGNVLDSLGQSQASVALQGAVTGTTMEDVLVKVTEGVESPRLFWGSTGNIQAGGEIAALPVLRLYRKVSMFALTLMKIPDVVYRIDMQFDNTYGSFNAAGSYTPNSNIYVFGSADYEQNIRDSILLDNVMLPTVENDSTAVQATFYLTGGGKQVVTFPKYFFRPNTITKVTATIDTDQSGNVWKVDVNALITVNVEWNVDQEPPITI